MKFKKTIKTVSTDSVEVAYKLPAAVADTIIDIPILNSKEVKSSSTDSLKNGFRELQEIEQSNTSSIFFSRCLQTENEIKTTSSKPKEIKTSRSRDSIIVHVIGKRVSSPVELYRELENNHEDKAIVIIGTPPPYGSR
jgi:hypothetical protein